jgi:hypothetical protein
VQAIATQDIGTLLVARTKVTKTGTRQYRARDMRRQWARRYVPMWTMCWAVILGVGTGITARDDRLVLLFIVNHRTDNRKSGQSSQSLGKIFFSGTDLRAKSGNRHGGGDNQSDKLAVHWNISFMLISGALPVWSAMNQHSPNCRKSGNNGPVLSNIITPNR